MKIDNVDESKRIFWIKGMFGIVVATTSVFTEKQMKNCLVISKTDKNVYGYKGVFRENRYPYFWNKLFFSFCGK